jgi:predicted protein tyrosine phosphatase
LITLLDPADDMPTPEDFPGHRHLRLGLHDIAIARPDYTAPDEMHVRELIAFTRDWDRTQPMLIHCWAGISRSTASAFTVACMMTKPGSEQAIAQRLAKRAARTAEPAHRGRRRVARTRRTQVDAVDAMVPAVIRRPFRPQLDEQPFTATQPKPPTRSSSA